MAIPDYQSLMLPILLFFADKKEHSLRETIEALSENFKLSEAERKELLPSGRQPVMDNRVGWARTYIAKAGLLESPRRGYAKITQRGLEVLGKKPGKINIAFLDQFDEFLSFRNQRKEETTAETENNIVSTPEESLETAYIKVNSTLADQLLAKIKECSPSFFERLVVELIVKMGYGGSLKDAGQAIGKSGDDGIDGIIKEDKLGLDIIYIQAKRWTSTVGRPEIQKFAGALQGNRATKGLFITTSDFSKEATQYVERVGSKIVLIDSNRLTNLMIEHNVGVSSVALYELKKIDSDYFAEE